MGIASVARSVEHALASGGLLGVRAHSGYLKYDAAKGSLNVYSEFSREPTPERTWKLPSGPAEQSLDLVELRVFLRASGRVICYCPEVPRRDAIGDTGIEYVRGIEQSGNNTAAMRLSAAVLGERRFVPQRAELLDALPNIKQNTPIEVTRGSFQWQGSYLPAIWWATDSVTQDKAYPHRVIQKR